MTRVLPQLKSSELSSGNTYAMKYIMSHPVSMNSRFKMKIITCGGECAPVASCHRLQNVLKQVGDEVRKRRSHWQQLRRRPADDSNRRAAIMKYIQAVKINGCEYAREDHKITLRGIAG